MSPAEGIGGEPPTCSWRVDVEGSHDVDALAKRVSVISASEDGAFERRIKNVATSGRPECTMRGVPAKSHCEVMVPLPEGASARAVAVVSGSRTVELYAVRAPSYERAYVKTVRASVVLPSSSETAGSSDHEEKNANRRRFECVAELGSVPCVALVLRLFEDEASPTHGSDGKRGAAASLRADENKLSQLGSEDVVGGCGIVVRRVIVARPSPEHGLRHVQLHALFEVQALRAGNVVQRGLELCDLCLRQRQLHPEHRQLVRDVEGVEARQRHRLMLDFF